MFKKGRGHVFRFAPLLPQRAVNSNLSAFVCAITFCRGTAFLCHSNGILMEHLLGGKKKKTIKKNKNNIHKQVFRRLTASLKPVVMVTPLSHDGAKGC